MQSAAPRPCPARLMAATELKDRPEQAVGPCRCPWGTAAGRWVEGKDLEVRQEGGWRVTPRTSPPLKWEVRARESGPSRTENK